MEKYSKLLTPEQFGVSHDRGFLPQQDPECGLPYAFEELEGLARSLPDLLGTGTIRQRVQQLSPLAPGRIFALTQREKIILMVRLGFIVSAYRYANAHLAFAPQHIRERIPHESEIVIPRNIALPFVTVAKELGVPPILSYSFYCLNNWWRFDFQKPVAVDNLRLLQHFLGGLDERHFILIHTEIERNLGPAVYAIPEAQLIVTLGEIQELAQLLECMAEAETNAISTMRRMRESCHPDIYYLRVRPYIFGFNIPGSPDRVVFEGADERVPVLRGETGAQTPSWPTLWAAMGIQFTDDALKHHVLEMRKYLMPQHLAYLQAVEEGPLIRQFVFDSLRDERRGAKRLRDAYNSNIFAIHRFFRLHLNFADIYINKKGRKYTKYLQQGKYGTGGTPFIQYLTRHCEEILAHRI